MKARQSKKPGRNARSRLDGARHWRRTLERYLTLYLMGGVSPEEISDATTAILKRQRHVQQHPVPTVEVLEYSRVLTHWRADPAFLDGKAIARPLPLRGRASFTALVKASLGDAKARDVLNTLRAHHLVTVDRKKRICMQSNAFLLKGIEKGHALGYSLSTLEGIVDTTYSNITTPDQDSTVGRFHRTVFAERFDERDLTAYDRFLREEGIQFLVRQDQWLKGRELPLSRKRRKTVYVGCGLFGIRSF